MFLVQGGGANVPCIIYDVLYLNVSLLNVTLLSSFYVHCKVTPLFYKPKSDDKLKIQF